MPLDNLLDLSRYKLKRDKSRWETPSSRDIPNQLPTIQPLVPQGLRPSGTMDDLKSALSLTQTLSGKPSPINTEDTTKPGNLYIATNPPGTGQLPRPGFDNTKFARIAGALGAAIAEPGSWQERVGGTAALLAGEEIKRKRKAPDEELARELIRARIDKLRTPEKEDIPTTAMAAYLRDEHTSEEIAAYKRSLSVDKRTEGIKYDEAKEKWFKGYYGEEGSFEARRELTPAEIEKQVTGKEKEGGYHYVTDDKGRVSVYQHGKLIKGTGKGKVSTKEGEKIPSPVTWTTATKELKGRFGKQDAIGNIIITPELQYSHRVAQKKLVELKAAGVKPLDAINQAEDHARNIESRYWEYIEATAGNRTNAEKVKKSFKQKYGYIPRMKR